MWTQHEVSIHFKHDISGETRKRTLLREGEESKYGRGEEGKGGQQDTSDLIGEMGKGGLPREGRVNPGGGGSHVKKQ